MESSYKEEKEEEELKVPSKGRAVFIPYPLLGQRSATVFCRGWISFLIVDRH
jgi:hypothetical protein